MSFIGIFDVIGPNMVGPSSSHTAGAVNIAYIARKMFGREVVSVKFKLYGSFANTYKGHGTDKALLGGILGFSSDDLKIQNSFKLATEKGIKYEFIPCKEKKEHPNTVDIEMTSKSGKKLEVQGVSVGGGKIKITEIDNHSVKLSGEKPTLIVSYKDKIGMLSKITTILSEDGINISSLRAFNDEKTNKSYSIIEFNQKEKSDKYISKIKEIEDILSVMLV